MAKTGCREKATGAQDPKDYFMPRRRAWLMRCFFRGLGINKGAQPKRMDGFCKGICVNGFLVLISSCPNIPSFRFEIKRAGGEL